MSPCARRGARWDPIDQSDTPKTGSPDRDSDWLRPKGSASGRGDVSPSSEVADVCKKMHTWSREGEHALPAFLLHSSCSLCKKAMQPMPSPPQISLTLSPSLSFCPFESAAGSLELISQSGPVQIRERHTAAPRGCSGADG